jgi:hypothetical protein
VKGEGVAVIDTTEMTLEEVVRTILGRIENDEVSG